MKPITESNIETFAIETLESLGWKYAHGLRIAPSAEFAERESFEQIILVGRLRKIQNLKHYFVRREHHPVFEDFKIKSYSAIQWYSSYRRRAGFPVQPRTSESPVSNYCAGF